MVFLPSSVSVSGRLRSGPFIRCPGAKLVRGPPQRSPLFFFVPVPFWYFDGFPSLDGRLLFSLSTGSLFVLRGCWKPCTFAVSVCRFSKACWLLVQFVSCWACAVLEYHHSLFFSPPLSCFLLRDVFFPTRAWPLITRGDFRLSFSAGPVPWASSSLSPPSRSALVCCLFVGFCDLFVLFFSDFDPLSIEAPLPAPIFFSIFLLPRAFFGESDVPPPWMLIFSPLNRLYLFQFSPVRVNPNQTETPNVPFHFSV